VSNVVSGIASLSKRQLRRANLLWHAVLAKVRCYSRGQSLLQARMSQQLGLQRALLILMQCWVVVFCLVECFFWRGNQAWAKALSCSR
jgi:hypothetical protein